jgi:glyoxylate reductase
MADQRILITRRVPPPLVGRLQEAGYTVDVLDQDDPPTREEFLERVPDVVAIAAMLSEKIDDQLLDAAGDQLKVVANFAVGFDNIDLDACDRRNVVTTNTPGVLTEATADIAWALILATARHVVAGDRLVRSGNWNGWAPMQFLGLELTGATLGIVGAGRIGSATARRSKGFNMRVLYTSRSPKPELERDLNAQRVELNALLTASDIVSLHVPLTSETKHLLGARELAAMRSSAILINTARGAVIDEAALIEALRERTIAGAGLDVYECEPRLSPGLAELDNVTLLPHVGSGTHTTRQKMAEMVVENILAVLADREPPNPIRA